MEPQSELVKDLVYKNYEHQMRKGLKQEAAKYPLLPGLCYTSFYDFLDQHGRAYRPCPYPAFFRRGPQLQCYGNALVMAVMYHFRYVEGVALAPTGQVIPHAWNVTGEGNVLDITWRNSALIYFGCEFSLERADDATWNGDACVLDDLNRGYPIFQKPWTGEDYTLRWPHSDRIEALRKRDGSPGASVLEYLESKGRTWEHPPM